MAKQQITASLVTRKVTERTKIFDTKCPGFYVSVTPAGVATFAFKYWDKQAGKQATRTIGTYDPKSLTAELARAEAQDLSARVGRAGSLPAPSRVAHALPGAATVGKVIDDFVTYYSTDVAKADGKKRARLESWKNVQGFLEREVRPAIGKMVASEVTNNDIARIQERIAKRSTSGARQTRSAMSRLFRFAAEAGKPYGVTCSPVHNLPQIDKEYERTVVLNEEEIRTLWWGLDHPDLPCTKPVALAIKFELVSMLRSQEILTIKRDRITGLGTENPVLRVPAEFVKKRRVIDQPLNSRAVEIVEQAMRSHNHDLVFPSRSREDEPRLNRSVLNQALKGRNGRLGIIAFLGMKKDFTPHDLRRTAATLCGDIGIPDHEIAKCLDHSKDRGEDVVEAPTVTGRVYVQSKRLKEKRAVLDALDAELRRIIGQRPMELPCARRVA